jgi:thermitase
MHSHRLLVAALGAASIAAGSPIAYADTGTVIVRLGAHSSHRRLAEAGVGRTIAPIAGTGARLVRVTGDPAAVAARLAHTRGVRWAEPNFAVHALGAPNDAQWRALYGVQRVGAPAFWDAHGLGSFPASGGVPVGIVDTGIDGYHEDLAGKVRACGAAANGVVADGDCADAEGHGTHVAGTIGALANNGVGVAGVAFNAPLIICRALGGADGSGTVADVAACVRWVHDRGAKVISMSLGGPSSRTLAEAAKSAYARGGARARCSSRPPATTATARSSTRPGSTRWSRSARSTVVTASRRSPTRTPTSRWRRQASTSSPRSSVGATCGCRAPRWRPRTSRAQPPCCGG